MTQWTYFAQDGSYGDAKDLVIIDTTNWNEYQWESIDYVDNPDLVMLAEKTALDNKSFVIYGDEITVETPAANAHITPKGKAFLAGLSAGLSTQDAIIYAENETEVL
jgi:hypothetical protein